MPLVTGYMNVYRSGWFHRQGKPGAFDRHAGDIYPTMAAAMENIEPRSHYLATTSVTWWEDSLVQANSQDSNPVSLATTRRPYVRQNQIEKEREHATAP